MKEELLEMTATDLRRLHVIKKAAEKEIKQRRAAEILGLGVRQVGRLIKRLHDEGEKGIIHKLRGLPSNHRTEESVRSKILDLYSQRYDGFGPTLAVEKLAEDYGLTISDETLRLWLRDNKLFYPQRRHRPHRNWRKRKSHRGEMIQLDGSHHDWLEGRGPKLVLMAYIDDATNEVFARFYEAEETFSAFDSFKRYVKKNGLPCALYTDRHSIYKGCQPGLTISEQLEGLDQPLSNFGRALKQLGVELIYAYSPQAKGRIERLFLTLQDRLVKEMRLRGTSNKVDANRFLPVYLRQHNKKYTISAENSSDLHRSLPEGVDLRQILCVKEQRILRNDFTVLYQGKFYQIMDPVHGKTIVIEKWIDSSLHFRHNKKELRFKEIQRLKRNPIEGPGKNHQINRSHTPSKNHPWRQFEINPSRV